MLDNVDRKMQEILYTASSLYNNMIRYSTILVIT